MNGPRREGLDEWESIIVFLFSPLYFFSGILGQMGQREKRKEKKVKKKNRAQKSNTEASMCIESNGSVVSGWMTLVIRLSLFGGRTPGIETTMRTTTRWKKIFTTSDLFSHFLLSLSPSLFIPFFLFLFPTFRSCLLLVHFPPSLPHSLPSHPYSLIIPILAILSHTLSLAPSLLASFSTLSHSLTRSSFNNNDNNINNKTNHRQWLPPSSNCPRTNTSTNQTTLLPPTTITTTKSTQKTHLIQLTTTRSHTTSVASRSTRPASAAAQRK